jgi:hypothetical protein
MAFTGQLATADAKPGNVELGGPVALTPIPLYPKVIAEIDWDDNPTLEFPPTGYTDVTNRVRGFTTNRGRNNFVDRVEAGTATILFDNRDGYFSPSQPGRLLGRKVRLRAYYDSTFFPLIVGHIESYQFMYPGTDMDAVCQVSIADGMKVLAQQEFRTDYVRENEAPSVRVVSALTEAGIGSSYQSVVNTLGTQVAPVRVTQPDPAPTQAIAATLSNLSSTITVADTSGIIPGTTVTAPGIPAGNVVDQITSSTTFTIRNDTNTGYGKAFLSRTKDTQYPGSPGPWYEIDGISDTKDLSVGMFVGDYLNINSDKLFDKTLHFLSEVQENAVKTGAAITNTWRGPTDVGGYATGVPFGAPTSATLTLPRIYLTVAGILDHIRQIEATERGTFVVLADGTYQYQGAGFRAAQPVSVSFGENTSAGEIPYQEAPVVYDDTSLANEYLLHNVYNDTVTVVSNAVSDARYFTRSAPIDQLFYANTTFLPEQDRVFEPFARVEGLQIVPEQDPLTMWRKVLPLEVSSRCYVYRRPLFFRKTTGAFQLGVSQLDGTQGLSGADSDVYETQFVEAIEHDGTPNEWRVKFITSPARS